MEALALLSAAAEAASQTAKFEAVEQFAKEFQPTNNGKIGPMRHVVQHLASKPYSWAAKPSKPSGPQPAQVPPARKHKITVLDSLPTGDQRRGPRTQPPPKLTSVPSSTAGGWQWVDSNPMGKTPKGQGARAAAQQRTLQPAQPERTLPVSPLAGASTSAVSTAPPAALPSAPPSGTPSAPSSATPNPPPPPVDVLKLVYDDTRVSNILTSMNPEQQRQAASRCSKKERMPLSPGSDKDASNSEDTQSDSGYSSTS